MTVATSEEVLTGLLSLCRNLGRPPTYRELGELLGMRGPSSVHDNIVRLRAAGVLRRELTTTPARIALSRSANIELARIILGLREPEDVARDLLRNA